jgi:outer membrane immunogenic protein
MRKLLLLVPLLSWAGASASAQSAFKGFYATAALGMDTFSPAADDATLKVRNGPFAGTYPQTTTYPRAFDLSGTLSVGSLSAITSKFLLGIGVEYEAIGAGTDSVKSVGAKGNVSYSTYRQKSHYNIFLSPAYALREDKLVYGKIGYSNSTSDADFDGAESPEHIAEGAILGAGYRQIVSGGLFFFGEANYFHYLPTNYSVTTLTRDGVLYTSDSKISSKGFSTLVGIGYTLPRSLTRK